MIKLNTKLARQINLTHVFVRLGILFVLLAGTISCGGASGDNANGTPSAPPIPSGPSAPSAPDPDDFVDIMSDIRDEYALPAVASALAYNGEVIFNRAVGLRSANANVAVSSDDAWHLGSITKSVTATLAARLVERGLINWTTTLGELYPELASAGNGQFDYVTLEQLLTHHSGLPRNINWFAYANSQLDLVSQRQRVVSAALNAGPVNNGDAYHYSNLGFVVAGSMLETVAGKSWEALVQEEVFTPLGIHDAGFGAPGGELDQPYGHLEQNGGYTPVAPTSDSADNPPVIGPAGTLHMPLASLLKYANAHMVGELGESSLLSAASFTRLHQPASGSDYAMGWFVQADSIFHDGSNNMWFAKLGISAAQQLIIISVTNAGGQDANEATDKITNAMLQHFFEG